MKNLYFEVGKYRALLNTENGEILAREKTAQHRQLKTNINAFVNAFPYEDKDFLILTARQKASENFIDRRRFSSFYGTI